MGRRAKGLILQILSANLSPHLVLLHQSEQGIRRGMVEVFWWRKWRDLVELASCLIALEEGAELEGEVQFVDRFGC